MPNPTSPTKIPNYNGSAIAATDLSAASSAVGRHLMVIIMSNVG